MYFTGVSMFLDEKELRARLGISHGTIWRWARAGLLPAPVRLGPRKIGWRISDIEKFEAERQTAPAYQKAEL